MVLHLLLFPGSEDPIHNSNDDTFFRIQRPMRYRNWEGDDPSMVDTLINKYFTTTEHFLSIGGQDEIRRKIEKRTKCVFGANDMFSEVRWDRIFQPFPLSTGVTVVRSGVAPIDRDHPGVFYCGLLRRSGVSHFFAFHIPSF